VYQPYFSVSRSPETGRYRIWYGVADEAKSGSRSHVGYMDRTDGIHWIRPGRVLRTPRRSVWFGSHRPGTGLHLDAPPTSAFPPKAERASPRRRVRDKDPSDATCSATGTGADCGIAVSP